MILDHGLINVHACASSRGLIKGPRFQSCIYLALITSASPPTFRLSPLCPDYVRFGKRTKSVNACSEEQSALDIAWMRRFNEENQFASPSTCNYFSLVSPLSAAGAGGGARMSAHKHMHEPAKTRLKGFPRTSRVLLRKRRRRARLCRCLPMFRRCCAINNGNSLTLNEISLGAQKEIHFY